MNRKMLSSSSAGKLLRVWRFACALGAALVLCPWTVHLAAAQAQTPEAKAAAVVGHARELAVAIERGHLSREAERKQWNEMRGLVDSEAISQFVLGPKWNDATPAQRRAFAMAVSDLVVQRLINRLGNPMAEPFELGQARVLDGGDVVVVSHVKFIDGHTGELDWRLHSSADKVAVADVLVDGASVAVAARDEAATELKANGGSIAQLIASMRNRLRFR